MINGKRVLGLIPARGGSKGIKDKNIIDLCGKPLIAYTVETALKSKYIDSVVVTTDSEIIAEVAKQYGALIPFIRPKEYAEDGSTTLSAVLHAIDRLKQIGETYDILILLQPTSPLRTELDINKAFEKFVENNMQGLLSIAPVDNHPILIRSISENNCLTHLLNVGSTVRRQDMPNYYVVNGAIYINLIEELNGTTSFNDNVIPYIMEKSHSIDIDEPLDLQIASIYLK